MKGGEGQRGRGRESSMGETLANMGVLAARLFRPKKKHRDNSISVLPLSRSRSLVCLVQRLESEENHLQHVLGIVAGRNDGRNEHSKKFSLSISATYLDVHR